MASPAEQRAMARAIDLAAHGIGRTSPNPTVGCAVLDARGEPAGEGFHARAGGPHAEVVALAEAGGRARGGTAVVTLEPCAHTGRTGPCTQALLDAGIARVVYAVDDPDPQAGGGARVLVEHGVAVEGGVLAEQAERVNEVWLTAVRRGRPHVTLKLATTLDGRIAAADGSSRWITGRDARAAVHRMRAQADAIVVGTGTALADDPSLTVRDADLLDGRAPLRVVVGERDLPAGARVLDGAAATLHLRTHDIARVLSDLAARDVRGVLVEGGATLAAAFLAADAVDRVVVHIAPVLLGEGPAALGGFGVGTIADALRLREVEIERLGDDVVVTGRIGAEG